ncbi:uncharacterized protein I303_103170 [Kwoniella dejecticola CBS 10117]|uniref:Protein FRA10AC1 n=1 Tax=Kwoniella dejecticola CBS 10117 TaxID=1296121 RepID=A0A1A6AAS3_9TREE|nr:uncharacterized protein I303_03191 [Kwoniella dejecticola CBS 10117]OBR87167.1 hypothetical protein I303_03191 [Kwoniella dejecticola CBS 10117]
MSWRSAGHLISGPPSASLPSSSSSTDQPLYKRLRPNSNGSTAYQRESSFAHHYGPDKDALSREERNRKSDWDVVRENHKFIRDDEEPKDVNVSWEERVARAYESKLFKEFALIDLKHYKSHAFALRWRTAPEVIDGIGETTCASLRCKYHNPSGGPEAPVIRSRDLRFKDPDTTSSTHVSSVRRTNHQDGEENNGGIREIPPLRSFELPFVYMENDQRKEALVKVRLCKKCEGKLRWKPDTAPKSGPGSKRENEGKQYGAHRKDRKDKEKDQDTEKDRDKTSKHGRPNDHKDDKSGRRSRPQSRSHSRSRSRSPSRSPSRSRRHYRH